MARRKQAVKVARRELVFEMWNRISPQEWESLSRETYEQLAKRDGITVPFYAAVAVSSKLREVLAGRCTPQEPDVTTVLGIPRDVAKEYAVHVLVYLVVPDTAT
jgi:hypothetical protein